MRGRGGRGGVTPESHLPSRGPAAGAGVGRPKGGAAGRSPRAGGIGGETQPGQVEKGWGVSREPQHLPHRGCFPLPVQSLPLVWGLSPHPHRASPPECSPFRGGSPAPLSPGERQAPLPCSALTVGTALCGGVLPQLPPGPEAMARVCVSGLPWQRQRRRQGRRTSTPAPAAQAPVALGDLPSALLSSSRTWCPTAVGLATRRPVSLWRSTFNPP